VKDLGWGSDHVGKLKRLQAAVKHLAEGKWTTSKRLEKATSWLTGLQPAEFPQHLRNRASNVLSLRRKYVFHMGGDSYFHAVKPSDRLKFIEDLLALYEACLIDLGRTWPDWDFMYPKDRPKGPPAKGKRQSKKRKR
jgi:hypothetical protein